MGKPYRAIIFLIICSLLVASFFVGYRYATYVGSKELHVIYANMVGSHITEVNMLLDMIDETADVSSVRRDFNESVLVDIGCSNWVYGLLNNTNKGLEEFYSGIGEASSILGATERECVGRLRQNLRGRGAEL